jgi:polar amino acid transport system substrate-binding protein
MRYIASAALAFTLIFSLSKASAETWTITSLKWPPFSGAKLEQQGAGIHALRTALETVGVNLKVRFMPWKRAKAMARRDAGIVGYYPSWPSEVVDGFVASTPVFRSPLGFAETTNQPLEWSELDDLRGRKVGLVKTYIYPEALEQRVADGSIDAVRSNTDLTALRLLARGRVDTVAIDKYVMRYYAATDPRLANKDASIMFDETVLKNFDLVLAFRDTAANAARAETLRKALANVDTSELIASYLARLEGA